MPLNVKSVLVNLLKGGVAGVVVVLRQYMLIIQYTFNKPQRGSDLISGAVP